MANPFSFQSGKPVTTFAHIFGTPLALQGLNWLPVNELLLWTLFTWHSMKTRSTCDGWRHLALGGIQMFVVLGSEWGHNLAHAAAARAVGKPVDAMRILVGMPVLLYSEPEHPSILPRQHLIRSLAGPVFNMLVLLVCKLFQRFTQPGSAAREVVDTAAGMNTFLSFGSLVPVPVFDGGPVLKWSLISQGLSPSQAETVAVQANRIIGPGLVGASAVAIHKHSWLLAAIFTFLGCLCLSIGFEKKSRAL